MTAGDFAALLYTWMIPHAEDDARLTGDPEELMMMVCPGRRDKTPDDIAAALQAMHDLGLVEWNQEAGYVQFPASFYGYQTYITDKRKGAQNNDPSDTPPQNSAKQRKSPQNPASLKVRVSSSVSLGDEDAQVDDTPTDAQPPGSQASSSPPALSLVDQVQREINIIGRGVEDVVTEYAPKLDAFNVSIVSEAKRWRQDYPVGHPRGQLKNFRNWLDVAIKDAARKARASPSSKPRFTVFGEKSA